MAKNDTAKVEEILTRGVEEIFIKEHLKESLLSGKTLTVKLGIDPTGPAIHLGRAIPLWKLKSFQDLGHNIVLVIGDFTAKIGDPSDKLEKRPMLSSKDIEKNMRDYKKIIGKILNLKKTKFVYNSKWLSKLTFSEITELADSFSVLQMSNRRNFKERLDKGEEVSLREFLYPLMQGYDSVAIKADVELGGFDQLFNLKAGRTIQKYYKQKEQDILTTKMLLGTDGRKMSTSWGNVINITDEPNDMFGKIMSLKDELMENYFLLCTELSEVEIKKIISENANPRDSKIILAETITSIYHGKTKGVSARENFVKTFVEKKLPENILETRVKAGELLFDIFLKNKIGNSSSKLRQLFFARAIEDMVTHEKIIDVRFIINSTSTFKIGKHRFLKVIVEN